MRYILLSVFFVSALFTMKASAQETIIDEINYTQLEEFIALAKANYPKNKIVALNEKLAKGNIRTETLGFLDMFSASYYYRPNDKAAINPDNPYIFNGIQYGIGTSLGALVERPFRIKEAKLRHQIAIEVSLDYEKTLTQEVKNRYYTYILQLKELKLKTQAVQDAKGIADDVATRFQRGEIELEAYNSSKSNYNSAISTKIQTEVAYLTARDELESVIGQKVN